MLACVCVCTHACVLGSRRSIRWILCSFWQFHSKTRGLKHPYVKLSNHGFHRIHVTVYFMFLSVSFFQAGDGVGLDGSWEHV